jgi:hypothetical protein
MKKLIAGMLMLGALMPAIAAPAFAQANPGGGAATESGSAQSMSVRP